MSQQQEQTPLQNNKIKDHNEDQNANTPLKTVIYLLKAGLPTVLTSICTFLFDTISLFFVGRLNNGSLLAAVGFSLSLSSAFGIAIVFGLSAGFGTLASQAFGAKNYYKFGTLFHKIWTLMAIMWLVVGILLWNAGSIFEYINFQQSIASQIKVLIRAQIPAIMGHSMFQMYRFYLMVNGKFNIPAYVEASANLIHLCLCYYFYEVAGYTFYGVSIARGIAEFSSALIMFAYIKTACPCKKASVRFSKESLKGFKSFVLDVFSHGTTIYIECIVLNLSSIITGLLREQDVLAAHSAMLNFLFVIIMPFYGTSISLNTLVGKAAGEGNVPRSKKLLHLGLAVNLGQAFLLLVLIMIFQEQIEHFYSDVEAVDKIMGTMLVYYCWCLPADVTSNTLGSSLRALGCDRYVFKAFIFAYYAVGTLFSYLLGIRFHIGFKGIWAGLLMGYYVMLILMVLKLWKLEWKEAIHEIQEKNKKEAMLLVAKDGDDDDGESIRTADTSINLEFEQTGE